MEFVGLKCRLCFHQAHCHLWRASLIAKKNLFALRSKTSTVPGVCSTGKHKTPYHIFTASSAGLSHYHHWILWAVQSFLFPSSKVAGLKHAASQGEIILHVAMRAWLQFYFKVQIISLLIHLDFKFQCQHIHNIISCSVECGCLKKGSDTSTWNLQGSLYTTQSEISIYDHSLGRLMHFFIYIHFSNEVHFLTSYRGGNNKVTLAVKVDESNVQLVAPLPKDTAWTRDKWSQHNPKWNIFIPMKTSIFQIEGSIYF